MSGTVPRQVRVFASLRARDLSVTLTYRGWLAWQGALALGATVPVSTQYLVTYFVMVSVVTSSWTTRFLSESLCLGHLSA